MTAILSIDQGTSSTKSVIIDQHGSTLGLSQKEHTQYYPHDAWVEHDPHEIKNAVQLTMKKALEQSKLAWSDISAIGITNQRETVVAWDKNTGQAIGNAIVWQCRRTASIIDQLKSEYKDLFQKKTGLVLDAYFSGTKMRWMIENNSKIADKIKNDTLKFGTIDSWITWFLTNQHRTDASNASRTLLYNIRKGEWDDELGEILKIPLSSLPDVQENAGEEPFGYYKIDGYDIPIRGILGDQQAALFGQAAFEPGNIKSTYGTGNFILANTGEKIVNSESGLLSTVAWELDGKFTYALEGSVFVTGSALQWLRDKFNLFDNYRQIDEIASQEPNSGGVVFVPALVGLGAPHWDSNARGLIIGITRSTNRANLLHATLDSIAYQTQELLTLINLESNLEINHLNVDGGITRSDLLMQKQANISGITINRPKNIETTALGAALIAGYKLLWDNLDDLSRINPIDKSYQPNNDPLVINPGYWNKAVNRSKNWL